VPSPTLAFIAEDMMADLNEQNVRDQFWPKFLSIAASLPFADQILAAWYCATDSATPIKVRATLFGALAYFILPFDVIPDFMIGLGYTDDMAVLVAAVTLVRNHILPKHTAQALQKLADIKSAAQASSSP
jgi:uncharacterized membrane protein YkvA (DUF1232 family)